MAVAFFQTPTSRPDIGLLQEPLQIVPDEELTQRLLFPVPFTLGSEYITEEWIANIFEKLNGIFAEEIPRYHGTAALYLAEKSQHLKVPERIFSSCG